MSDHIPLEVQEEIMKWLPVKLLIQFRSVSKAWKNLIDSPKFIAAHTTRHSSSDSRRLFVRYEDPIRAYKYYISFVDDDTFPQQNFQPAVPLSIDLLHNSQIIGSSHGLLCVYGLYQVPDDSRHPSATELAVIWNPSIRKSVPIVVPNALKGMHKTVLGFGVCPTANDPKLVKINYINLWSIKESDTSIPSQVEVFSLSSGTWRSLSNDLPRKSIQFSRSHTAIDGFIYWIVWDRIALDDRKFRSEKLIMSFNLTTEEFTEVNLPDRLTHRLNHHTTLSISKLKESVAVVEYTITAANKQVCNVWEMKNDVSRSFTKLYTIKVPYAMIRKVLVFRKSGKPVIELEDYSDHDHIPTALIEYEPCSKSIDEFGICGKKCSFFVSSYRETLLLLNQRQI